MNIMIKYKVIIKKIVNKNNLKEPFLHIKNLPNNFFWEIWYPIIKYGKNAIILTIDNTKLKHCQYPSKSVIIILIGKIKGILFNNLIEVLQINKDNKYQKEFSGYIKFIGEL